MEPYQTSVVLGRWHFSLTDCGMGFNFFSQFPLMASIDSKSLHRSGNFTFGNRKKSHRAVSGEYGTWKLRFFAFWSQTLLRRQVYTMVRYLRAKSKRNFRDCRDIWSTNLCFKRKVQNLSVIFPLSQNRREFKSVNKTTAPINTLSLRWCSKSAL